MAREIFTFTKKVRGDWHGKLGTYQYRYDVIKKKNGYSIIQTTIYPDGRSLGTMTINAKTRWRVTEILRQLGYKKCSKTPPKRRTFNKKVYELYAIYDKKKEALEKAKYFKKFGGYARVVQVPNCWGKSPFYALYFRRYGR